MYYVSETDMLKAMRMALYDEVVRTPGYIQGDNFTGLADFVTLLSDVCFLQSLNFLGVFHVISVPFSSSMLFFQHFPVLSFTNDIRRSKRTTSTVGTFDRVMTVSHFHGLHKRCLHWRRQQLVSLFNLVIRTRLRKLKGHQQRRCLAVGARLTLKSWFRFSKTASVLDLSSSTWENTSSRDVIAEWCPWTTIKGSLRMLR